MAVEDRVDDDGGGEGAAEHLDVEVEPQLRGEEVELGAQCAAQRAAVARLVLRHRARRADERRARQRLAEELQQWRRGGGLEPL
eukprot:scaffold23081_cov61-Phaeocystis_antarctica.AAC.6